MGENRSGWNQELLEQLIRELSELRTDLLRLEAESVGHFQGLSTAATTSATNLLHYLALRRHDIRDLQDRLASLGLSSLGRAEACVLTNLDSVLDILRNLARLTATATEPTRSRVEFAQGKSLLEAHTRALLGPRPSHRAVRIMVTMPSEAASDYQLVHDLLQSGMDCMRINCAHDAAAAWARMIEHLRHAERELGRKCRVLMDLAGPKLRTGPLEPGPQVLKWRPRRDEFGRVVAPARIWLSAFEQPVSRPSEADACLPVPTDWLRELRVGDQVRFTDARQASRSFQIVQAAEDGCWAESNRTVYVASGTRFRIYRPNQPQPTAGLMARIGTLPAKSQTLRLQERDTLCLTRDMIPGKPAPCDAQGNRQGPATIACTLAEVFADVKPGERIWLDDGKIGGVIRSVDPERMLVEITQARPGGIKLGADKGINLPDTTIRLPALTPKDVEDLAFIAGHADLVGLSFVREPADVLDLQHRLTQLGGERLGIVLKIETRRSFEQLPSLLLMAMHSPCVGVMIARGDLAVECGYERLAEIQEEILWICEAAHVPVIWATQVLENLAKDGLPSRAEITDAAMGERAECVMLNKGPHILKAMHVLDDILRRMQAHHSKKRPMLRHLKLADLFVGGSPLGEATHLRS